MLKFPPSRFNARPYFYDEFSPAELAPYADLIRCACELECEKLTSLLSQRTEPVPQRIATALFMRVHRFAEMQKNREKFHLVEGNPIDQEAVYLVSNQLILAGANPFITLSNRRMGNKAERIKLSLTLLPPGVKAEDNGYTLAHALCTCEEFVDEILPVLCEFRIDFNSVPRNPKYAVLGTALHLILAYEHFDTASTYLEVTRGKLDLSITDGERKTIPILAAKLGAESILIQLARLYPGQLSLTAQDNEGRTAAHYCFILGLERAIPFYMNADVQNIRDIYGRTPEDYLKIPDAREEISRVLSSIEIDSSRDAGAFFNAVAGNRSGRSIIIQGEARTTVRENFTDDLKRAAHAAFGDTGLAYIERQFQQLRGKSLLQEIIERRSALAAAYTPG